MSTPTAKDFQEPLLRVLGDLTGCTADSPIKGEDTYAPVMALMGITDINALGTEASSGQPLVARQIQWANKNLRKTGHTALEGRGLWTLTAKGVQEIQNMTPTTTTAVSPAPPAPVVPLTLPATTTRSPFLDDPYILERVLSATPCLGHYTPHKGAECVGCPVATECQNALYARMTTAASALAKADAVAAAKAAGVAAAKAAAVAKAAAARRLDKDSARKIEAFEEANCIECGKVIAIGTHMIWADDIDTGEIRVMHIKCFEAQP